MFHIRYDNLKAAVSRVLFGRNRTESARWVAFRSHGFESFYCHPASKGRARRGASRARAAGSAATTWSRSRSKALTPQKWGPKRDREVRNVRWKETATAFPSVETNSEARMDRVLAVLDSLQAGLELLKQSRDQAPDLMEAMSRTPGGATGTELDLENPSIAAALEEVALKYEQNWLDESIPAFAGATPREAAADPTRRPDLLRLLNSFPHHGPGLMNADRLRAALGL